MARFQSVRNRIQISRSGLLTPASLAFPIESHALSNAVLASGTIRITPDYDVLAWLCESWLKKPSDSGWIYPTLYEIASDLYPNKDAPPSGRHYQLVRKAIGNLAMVSVKIAEFNGRTGEVDPEFDYVGHLLESNIHRQPVGAHHLEIKLAEWLRDQLAKGATVRLDWKTLRAFNENQKLAKRLWIYLQAEHWKRYGDGSMEGTWITFGDRLQAALGMDYDRSRDARAALKRACQTIREVDDRYLAGSIELVKLGRGWRIQAERPTAERWRGLKPEYTSTRAGREAARKTTSLI